MNEAREKNELSFMAKFLSGAVLASFVSVIIVFCCMLTVATVTQSEGAGMAAGFFLVGIVPGLFIMTVILNLPKCFRKEKSCKKLFVKGTIDSFILFLVLCACLLFITWF